MHTTTTIVPRDIRTLGVPWGSPVFLFLSSLATGSRPTQIGALRHVAAFLGSSVASYPWESLGVAEFTAVRSWAAERFRPATANRILCAVRGVLRAAARLGLTSQERVLAVCSLGAVPGRSAPAGRALEPDELRALLSTLLAAPTLGRARTAAALALCYGAGLRRAEATSLTLERLEGTAVRVRGKGNTERIVPLPATTRRVLSQWLELRGSEPGWVLCRLAQGGGVLAAERVKASNVFEWCRSAARSAGVAPFSPHDLRRTYVGDLLDLGADLASVQALVGHADPATTARYDRRPARAREAAVLTLDRLPWGDAGAPRADRVVEPAVHDPQSVPARELRAGSGAAGEAPHRPRLESGIREKPKPERKVGTREPPVSPRRAQR